MPTPSTYIALLAGLGAALYLLQHLLSRSHNPREPPLVHPRFPLFGHLYGVLSSGTGYWGQIKIPRSQLIYTAQLFSLRVYVLNGTQLLTAVQRAARTLSFRPVARQTVLRFSEPEQAVLDACDEEGEGAFVHEMEEEMKRALAPGPGLDRMNVETAGEIVRCLDGLAAGGESDGVGVDLLEWVRETITVASTRGVYGPDNPYGTAEARAAFWCVVKQGRAHIRLRLPSRLAFSSRKTLTSPRSTQAIRARQPRPPPRPPPPRPERLPRHGSAPPRL